MRLTRIEIDGFGRLRDFRKDIGAGLHIFFGPNESGKSTLQQSILALLYNFYAGDRAHPAESRARERFRPWGGRSYGGRLEYELQAGGRFRVQRDFSSDEVPTSLWELATGRDATDDFGRGRHGNVPFAQKQLGMTKDVFDACAFVSQGELFQLAEESPASPQEIGDTIISLADSARRDVSAQSAIDHLDRVLKDQVGGPRARTAPLAQAERRRDELRAELEQIDAVRVELARDASRLELANREREELSKAALRSRFHLAWGEATDVQTRLDQLDALSRQEEAFGREIEGHAALSSFPVEERDGVLEKWTSVQDLRDALRRDQPEGERSRGRLAELAGQRQAHSTRVQELAHLRDFPVDRKAAIDASASAWRDARTVAGAARERLTEAETPSALAEEFTRLEAEVGRLSSRDLDLLTERLRAPAEGWVGRALGAAGRAVVAALRWLWGSLVALARAVARSASRASETAPDQEASPEEPPLSRTFDSMSLDDAAALLERHRRYLELAPAVGRSRDAAAASGVASATLQDAARRLSDALEGLVDERDDLDRAYQLFLERAEGYEELLAVERELSSLDRERSSLQEAVGRSDADRERLSALASALREQLRRATGRDGDLEDLVEAFEDGCRRRELYDDAKRGLRENEEKRAIILEGRSAADLQGALEAARSEQERLVAELPTLEGARSNERREGLQASLAKERRQVHDLEIEIGELRTKISTRQSGLRHRAEVEEDLERFAREVERLGRFRDELGIAMEVIEQAMTEAHRDFAPSVGRFLGDRLARVSGGRYGSVLLDPSTLNLTTEVPETRRLEPIESLSRGTRAAAYLLLRAGLAQHMSTMGEPVPLILDDPLVDLDHARVENFLEVLLDLTDEVQVLLFTKDERTRAWFERRCGGNGMHKMTLLPGPDATGSQPPPELLRSGSGS